MDNELQLEHLFRACDKHGTGHIGPVEFRELCTGFDIDHNDSDIIFNDLDHDGDGQVSLEDFAWGFRDFLTPGSRRGSMQIGIISSEIEKRHQQAKRAWSHLVAGVGEINVQKFLNASAPKLAELYEELQTTETAQHLVTHFEGALSSLLLDVKKLYEDNKKMEEMYAREKEVHLEHLRNLEEELDAQVARVEEQAREEARIKFEAEKRNIEERMEAETAELQAHLKLFQKLNSILSRGKGEKQNNLNIPDIGQETASENRELRHTLADTKTNLALLRSEMAQLRSEYEEKCRELNSHQETVMVFMHKNDHVQRQLNLLHEANSKLQDTNDSLLTVMDISGVRSRPSSPYCCSHASSSGSLMAQSEGRKRKRQSQPVSQSASDVESVADSGPASLGSTHTGIGNDVQFGIRRLMEDLDSGRSTMRDNMDIDSDKSLQDELLTVATEEQKESEVKSEDIGDLIESQKSPITRRRLISPGNSIQIPLSPILPRDLEPTGVPDRTYKIVFAGDAAVGKSCFIFRFCKGVFINNLGSTLGVDFQVKTIRVDERNVTLQLWDTAGQERFRSMTKTYFRRADGVMLLYDVTNERSFLSVRQWIESIDEVTEQRIPIILCGNKVDLRLEARSKGVTCIDMLQGELLARDFGATFLETSSKAGTNILDAVLTLSREMLMREDVEVQTSSLRISPDQKPTNMCCSRN